MSRAAAERGFTLFELLSVMAAIAILGALSLPTIVKSLHQGRVNDAAMQIVTVANEAHQQALQRRRLSDQLAETAGEPVPYGFAIRPRSGSEAAHVVLIGWKPGVAAPVELGRRRYFNDNVDVYAVGTGGSGTAPTTPAPAQTSVYFEFGSGFPGLAWARPGGVTALGATQGLFIVVGTRDLAYDGAGRRWSAGLGATVRVYPFVGTADAQTGQTP